MDRRHLQGPLPGERVSWALAVTTPSRPGLPVRAIECDGAHYHSSPAARDRDRICQEQLERLGWRFHRREEEVDRALNSHRRALDALDGGPVAPADDQPALPKDDDSEPEPRTSEPWERPDLRHLRKVTEIPERKLIRLARSIPSGGRTPSASLTPGKGKRRAQLEAAVDNGFTERTNQLWIPNFIGCAPGVIYQHCGFYPCGPPSQRRLG